MQLFRKNILFSLLLIAWGLGLPAFSFLEAEEVPFFVDSQMDEEGRGEIEAELIATSQHAYFFIDKEWQETLSPEEKEENVDFLESLGTAFDEKIYPGLTSVYGSEWKPGIDRDLKVTILFHPLKEGSGGYFRPVDEEEKLESPNSNEREMIYVNAHYLPNGYLRSLLSHELVHLITYNQKERKRGETEEIWLNEARAEYAPTLLGYDQIYQGSNLQRRAQLFLTYPTDSLVEWQEREADYGALNLFIHYLVEHYGIDILIDSLQSSEVGIASLNEALEKNEVSLGFNEIFTNWTIASYLNDCQIGSNYCYLDAALQSLKVTPKTYFLPLTGDSSLSSTDQTKVWSGKWLRFIGGEGDLTLRFVGNSETLFRVPYILEMKDGKTKIGFLDLAADQKGEFEVPNFGAEVSSLTIIPSIQDKVSGFNGRENSYAFFWEVTTDSSLAKEREKEELRKTIRELETQIEVLRSQLSCLLLKRAGIQNISFESNLSWGIRDQEAVMALQLFLVAQGEGIYPAGLITGNYLSLTQEAVKRFQEKYREEILEPVGLVEGTGFFGPQTREKVNSLLSNCSIDG
jgi:hypothetical protein